MSENFQACAQLDVEDIYSKSTNTLGDIMDLQKDIQENVYKYDFAGMQQGPLSELKKFIDWNEEAIRDEQREFANALGGIHSHSNALWKPWKSKHGEANAKSFMDLTEEEKLELQYEWIDQLHFFFNIGLAVGMTPQRTMDMYYAKNKENRRRQNQIGGY